MAIKKRAPRRPRGNPDDVKSASIPLYIHPDLNAELIKVARAEGTSKSTLINGLLIRLVNDRRDRVVLDNIGRHAARRSS
jgi:hypothetical protein